MGRRKIEIKAIKDDRNRSVTFLKRKGGLFKKAHELSVLCSVEVAVIIFGHNKKLYEFSSGDIHDTINKYRYYGIPHEHKGPSDYIGKRDGDDDEEDEVDDANGDEQAPADPNVAPPQVPNQAKYAHMRPGPSASPPANNNNNNSNNSNNNGAMPYHPRAHTPQPPMGSRPSSRNTVGRPGPNLVPQHSRQARHGPHPPNGFAYMPNSVYNMQGPPSVQESHVPGQQTRPYPPPQYGQAPLQQAPQAQMQQAPQAQMQQAYMQGRARQPMPPAFSSQDRPHSQPQVHVQAPEQSLSPPQQDAERRAEGLRPFQPKPVKQRSIFTPIDDRSSMLAQSWGLGTTPTETQQAVKVENEHRPQSLEGGSVQRSKSSMQTPSAKPDRVFSQPDRCQSIMSISGGDSAKRPRLKVQIPSEKSDDGASPNAGSSAQEAVTGETPARSTETSHSSGVVLPPPSPSASAILSAGTQGPPNPFARPLPPGNISGQNGQAYASNNNIETPMSALPSRFVSNQLLPSPSQFFSEWNFGRSGDEGNMLPSPLTFPTPVVQNGSSFLRDEEGDRKRKSPEGDGQQEPGNPKRVKA